MQVEANALNELKRLTKPVGIVQFTFFLASNKASYIMERLLMLMHDI